MKLTLLSEQELDGGTPNTNKAQSSMRMLKAAFNDWIKIWNGKNRDSSKFWSSFTHNLYVDEFPDAVKRGVKAFIESGDQGFWTAVSPEHAFVAFTLGYRPDVVSGANNGSFRCEKLTRGKEYLSKSDWGELFKAVAEEKAAKGKYQKYPQYMSTER